MISKRSSIGILLDLQEGVLMGMELISRNCKHTLYLIRVFSDCLLLLRLFVSTSDLFLLEIWAWWNLCRLWMLRQLSAYYSEQLSIRQGSRIYTLQTSFAYDNVFLYCQYKSLYLEKFIIFRDPRVTCSIVL